MQSNFSNNIPSNADCDAHSHLQAKLLETSIKLNENYSQAAFELRTGRIGCECGVSDLSTVTADSAFSEIYSAIDHYPRAPSSRISMGDATEEAAGAPPQSQNPTSS